ncbi:glycosyltransferase family 4 protein [Nocardiopsis sp. Huas11]|uniref:glycosyltransferase family 4 protein n=1 Tax=Nocardiopsis sp. Huas11 TaxID=2183912 RepID=UPI0013158987|nr:glycosyltransferase family 4 protein [Nocardiopsis sp. Huas11]
MTERRALLYCTFNGVANCTNGIARQTQTLLSAFEHRREELFTNAGRFDLHVAIPAPGPYMWGYDPALLARSRARLSTSGAFLHFLDPGPASEFWSLPVWEHLSRQASALAVRLAGDYDQVLLIAMDTPYAGTGGHLASLRTPASEGVRVLVALYGTALLHRTNEPGRLEWEKAAITSTGDPRVRVGDVGDFFTRHLVEDYGLPPERLVPYTSSLDLSAADLRPLPRDHAHQILDSYGVPLDRPIVAAFGRTDPVKGMDLLINALGPLAHRVHLAAVVVPFHNRDPLLQRYRDQIRAAGLRATLVPRFTRDLPRALCSVPITRTVVCPSRSETLANVPFEVACWARQGGPVVTAPRLGGFIEQIRHGTTGRLYPPDRTSALTDAVSEALTLPASRLERMRSAAHAEVAANRDIVPNLSATLRTFWSGRADGALT